MLACVICVWVRHAFLYDGYRTHSFNHELFLSPELSLLPVNVRFWKKVFVTNVVKSYDIVFTTGV